MHIIFINIPPYLHKKSPVTTNAMPKRISHIYVGILNTIKIPPTTIQAVPIKLNLKNSFFIKQNPPCL